MRTGIVVAEYCSVRNLGGSDNTYGCVFKNAVGKASAGFYCSVEAAALKYESVDGRYFLCELIVDECLACQFVIGCLRNTVAVFVSFPNSPHRIARHSVSQPEYYAVVFIHVDKH